MFKDWSLQSISKNNGPKVLGTFLCGGGSTMGYKLAGFDHLGGVEIDQKMASMYKKNHKPSVLINDDIRNSFEHVQQFQNKIDLFDGSPPCSTFSTSGQREKAWGKSKIFREGQKSQRLDDLYFTFVDMAVFLNPAVIVSENVPGIIKGNAKAYVRQILDKLKKAGYETQIFNVFSTNMDMVQKRNRVFFVSQKKNRFRPIKIEKTGKNINFESIDDGAVNRKPIQPMDFPLWKQAKPGESLSKYHKKGNRFNAHKINNKGMCPTLTSHGEFYHWKEHGKLTENELRKIGSFPKDYNFNGNSVQYVCGMSVPPLLMKNIATNIMNFVF